MSAELALVLLQLAAGVVLVALLVGRHSWRRRSSFDETIAREHPELRTIVPHHGDVGLVAARAVDLSTPGAPRQLGDQVLR